MVSVTIRPTDPRLVAIKAELLHGIPELTGNQINRAAFLALVAIDKMERAQQVSSETLVLTRDPTEAARVYQKFMSGDG